MRIRNKGGLSFQVKGASVTSFSNLESEIKSCIIPLSVYQEGKIDFPKKEVKQGEVLIKNDKHIVLAPISGSAELNDKNDLVITASGTSDNSNESLELLKSGSPVETLIKLGLLENKETKFIDTVIVKLANTEPYFAKETTLLNAFDGNFNNALALIKELIPSANVKVLCSDYHTSDKITNSDSIDFLYIKDKYPFDNEKLLVAKLSGQAISNASLDKTLILPAEKLLLIYNYIKRDLPPTYNFISIAGNIDKPVFARIPNFTDINVLQNMFANTDGYEIIINGPFNGRSSLICPYLCKEDRSVTFLRKDTPRKLWAYMRPGLTDSSFHKSFLSAFMPIQKFMDNLEHGEKRACVFCGYCESHCPAGIIPFVLYKHTQIDELEDAKRYKILDCIDCGLCTYVCPSKITISEIIATGKDNIIKEGI